MSTIEEFLGKDVPTVSTQESWAIRRKAIELAPDHEEHTVLGHRVDTWRDVETGACIALIDERITQGTTVDGALNAAKSCIRIKARTALGISMNGRDLIAAARNDGFNEAINDVCAMLFECTEAMQAEINAAKDSQRETLHASQAALDGVRLKIREMRR